MARQSCCPALALPRRVSVWVALLGGLAFILIAADVVYHGRLQRMDMPVARWMAAYRPEWTAGRPPVEILIASFVTDLGSTPLIAGIAVITGGLLALYRKWRMLWWGAAAMIGEPVLNTILKKSFALPRPTLETSVYPLNHGYTFPSGHTMAACVAFGILAIYSAKLWPRWRALAWWAYAALCAATGAALIYIGVHYVTDVLAAYAISACWLGIMASVPAARGGCAKAFPMTM